jgi:hypothetical protein
MTMTKQELSGSAHWQMAVSAPFDWGKDPLYGSWGVRNTFLQFYDIGEDSLTVPGSQGCRRASSFGPDCASAESRKQSSLAMGQAQLQALKDYVQPKSAKVCAPEEEKIASSQKPKMQSSRLRPARGAQTAKAKMRAGTFGDLDKPAESLKKNMGADPATPNFSDDANGLPSCSFEIVPDASGSSVDSNAAKASTLRGKTVHFGNGKSEKIVQTRNLEVPAEKASGTTVMIRHIACRYTKDDVTAFLDKTCLQGKYDFVHLPLNIVKRANRGYVFVNFLSAEYAEECQDLLDGRVFGNSGYTEKICEVVPAHMQGFAKVPRCTGVAPDALAKQK